MSTLCTTTSTHPVRQALRPTAPLRLLPAWLQSLHRAWQQARQRSRERAFQRAVAASLRDMGQDTLRDLGMTDRVPPLPRSLSLMNYERGLW